MVVNRGRTLPSRVFVSLSLLLPYFDALTSAVRVPDRVDLK